MERDNAPVFSSFRSCTTSCQGFHASLLIIVLLIECPSDCETVTESTVGADLSCPPPIYRPAPSTSRPTTPSRNDRRGRFIVPTADLSARTVHLDAHHSF